MQLIHVLVIPCLQTRSMLFLRCTQQQVTAIKVHVSEIGACTSSVNCLSTAEVMTRRHFPISFGSISLSWQENMAVRSHAKVWSAQAHRLCPMEKCTRPSQQMAWTSIASARSVPPRDAAFLQCSCNSRHQPWPTALGLYPCLLEPPRCCCCWGSARHPGGPLGVPVSTFDAQFCSD